MNKPRTTTIQQPSQLFSLLTNSTLNVNTLRICTDEVMEAVTTSIEENVNKGSKTNIFIAAFTTCHARLTLYLYIFGSLGDPPYQWTTTLDV